MIMTFRGQLDLKKWKPNINSFNLSSFFWCISISFNIDIDKKYPRQILSIFDTKYSILCSYCGIEINMIYHNLA
jgi:hypothetical protein